MIRREAIGLINHYIKCMYLQYLTNYEKYDLIVGFYFLILVIFVENELKITINVKK